MGIVCNVLERHNLSSRMCKAALDGYLACGDQFGFDKDDSSFCKMLQGKPTPILLAHDYDCAHAADSSPTAKAGVSIAVEVGDEPRHRVVLENDYVRVIEVQFVENDETLIHTHSVDSLYFFLVPRPIEGTIGDGNASLQVLNTIYDIDTNTVTSDTMYMEYGECRFGNHCTKSLTHKIKCIKSGNGAGAHCMDVELKRPCPKIVSESTETNLVVDNVNVHAIKDKEKAKVFRVDIQPSCNFTFSSYPFFYLLVAMTNGESTVIKGSISWKQPVRAGRCEWHTPGEAPWSVTNDSHTEISFFLIQWK